MADERKVVYIEINASKAVEGSNQATQALKKLEASLDSMKGGLDKANEMLGKIGSTVKAHLAIYIAELAGKLLEMGKNAFRAAADMGELADQLGTTTNFLQSMQAAAVQNGLALEKMEQSFIKFSNKIGEATDGGKEAIETFEKFNVKILDVNKNLRPTEDILQDVAKAVISIEDPAKRVAAAMELFGKSGPRMLPVLQELAKGKDMLTAKAAREDLIISPEAIETLDKLADQMEKNALKTRKFFAEWIADGLNWLEKVNAYLEGAAQSFNKWMNGPLVDFFDSMKEGFKGLIVDGVAFATGFIAAIATIPVQMKKLFIDGINAAIDAVESGLNRLTAGVQNSWLGRQAEKVGITLNGRAEFGRLDGGGASFSDRNAQIKQAEEQARQAAAEAWGAPGSTYADRQRKRQLQGMVDADAAEQAARKGKLSESSAPGAYNPTPRSTEKDKSAENIAKLTGELERAAKAQDEMTAAALRGDVAFQEQQIRAKSLEQAMGAYSDKLAETDPRIVELTEKLVKLNRQITQGKTAEAFAVGTTELNKQNTILEKQIELMNEAPEIQAREIALIKAKQEAEKGGAAITQDMIDARTKAIEQNEKLKIQSEQLKKAQELWMEPLKTAFQDIQRAASDAFEKMLDSGKFNFEELGKVFGSILKKMAAELLALATIKPVINIMMNTIGGAFGVSPGIMNQVTGGVGGSSGGLSMGGLGSIFGSGGGGSGLSGLGSGWLSNLGNFWNAPIAGSWAGISNLPSGMYGPAPNTTGGLGLSGTTWGQGIGAAAGAGMGIYQLATAKGNTAKTIGGIASLVGAGVSLIPGIGQIAGPIIGLLGGLLPGLFGGEEPKIPPLNGANVRWDWNQNGGGYNVGSSEQNGGNSIAGLGSNAKTMADLYKMAGGVKDNSKIWGVAMWQNQRDGNATTYVLDPQGNSRQWGQGSNEHDIGFSTAMGHAALNSLLGGGVNISANMRKALENFTTSNGGAHFEDISQAVTEVKNFDDALAALKKTMSPLEQAFKGIDDQFQSLYDIANKYGLVLSQVDEAKSKAEQKLITDFKDSIRLGYLDLTDPKAANLERLDKEKQSLVEQNKYLVERFGATQDQMAQIEQYYAEKRKQIIEQYGGAATKALQKSLDDLIAQLTPGGALSNLDPTGQFAGLSATYAAARAKAFANPADQEAISAFNSAGAQYAQFGMSYFAGSSRYNALRDQIISDATSIKQAVGDGTTVPGDVGSPAQFAQLMASFQNLLDELASEKNENAKLKALMQQIVGTR